MVQERQERATPLYQKKMIDKKRVARFQVSSGSLQYSIYVEQAANI